MSQRERDRLHWLKQAEYEKTLQGVKVIVAAYNVLYGGEGIPRSRVIIDGFRKTGSKYELASETGAAFEKYGWSGSNRRHDS